MKTVHVKNQTIDLELTPEFGCHWLSLRFNHKGNWKDLLYPVPDLAKLPERSTNDGSYILAPWSNRLEKAAFQFEGKLYQLKPNFPDGTAIHGNVWTRPWKIEQADDSSLKATLTSSNFSDFNYPFPLTFILKMALTDNMLTTRLDIKNNHSGPAPVGLGFHPFWRRRLGEEGADVILKAPANKVYPTKEAIPQGPAEEVQGKKDLRQGQDLNGVDLDDGYTDLSEQSLTLTYPDEKIQIGYEFDSIFKHLVVYSPTDPKTKRPRDFVAVEPVTNATNGFNLLAKGWEGTGVKILKPNETWGGAWTLTFESL